MLSIRWDQKRITYRDLLKAAETLSSHRYIRQLLEAISRDVALRSERHQNAEMRFTVARDLLFAGLALFWLSFVVVAFFSMAYAASKGSKIEWIKDVVPEKAPPIVVIIFFFRTGDAPVRVIP